MRFEKGDMRGMDHRDFCVRLTDSYVLQWFLQISGVEGGKAFAKSSSERFAHIIDFDDVCFDSICLKAPIHYPVDWVLLRDATGTLMKATVLIRRSGLRHRMPQKPLSFLSELRRRLEHEPGMREGLKR